jgi:hypothetical protein
MKYIRCTRCELNYRTEEETFCKVCQKEITGDFGDPEEAEPEGDICPFCEENPLPYGAEMCGPCAAQRRPENDGPAPPLKTKISLIEIDK